MQFELPLEKFKLIPPKKHKDPYRKPFGEVPLLPKEMPKK